MAGTPLPCQLPPLSSSRAKQPGWCSSGTADSMVCIANFFLDFRVRMQPQTTSAIIAAKKFQVVGVASWCSPSGRHHGKPYTTVRASGLSQCSGSFAKSTAMRRASSRVSNFAADRPQVLEIHKRAFGRRGRAGQSKRPVLRRTKSAGNGGRSTKLSGHGS